MRPVHAFASARHLVDHLAPVWAALNPEERGTWWVQTRALGVHAAERYGVDVTVSRSIPNHGSTRTGGHQPHVLVASSGDAHLIGSHRRAVLLEHGAGQTYQGDPRSARSHGYAGGELRGMVDLFLCPNNDVAALNRDAYPHADSVVVGCPRLDRWHGWEPLPLEERRVAVTFHWPCRLVPEAGTAWGHYRQWFEQRPRFGPLLWGHAHPRHAQALSRWWPRVGATWVPHLDDVFAAALVFVADNTSAMFEAAAIGIPVVVLNSPQYRRDVDHGLRFWRWADIGPQVDHPADLEAAVWTDAYHPAYRVRRGQMARAVYGDLDGQASARAVAALRRHLP